jgi:2-oxoglutarate ferredoxin oxidoreductase subunit alpha
MKVMTATSGPGISLYSEHISFAVGSEIPIVIVDVQRLGPSTGSATLGADGDVQFLRWGNSGGLPVIVLAPSDVGDCYVLTVSAFNLAEEFRCPVFIASNKEIAMTRETVDLDAFDLPGIIERPSPPAGKRFIPFEAPSDSSAPYFLPMGGDVIVRQTSSTHGTDGYITTDSDEIAQIRDRLGNKLITAVRRFSYHESYLEENTDTLVLTYGITARAARDAYYEKKHSAKPVSLLILKTLWPVPEMLIREKAEKVQRVVVAEMNLGQYVREIQRILPNKTVDFLGRMDGRLISPQQIMEAIDG